MVPLSVFTELNNTSCETVNATPDPHRQWLEEQMKREELWKAEYSKSPKKGTEKREGRRTRRQIKRRLKPLAAPVRFRDGSAPDAR